MAQGTRLRAAARAVYRQWLRRRGAWRTTRLAPFSTVFYVAEPTRWAISEDARYLTDCLRRQQNTPAEIVHSPLGLRQQIVHFGSRNLFLLGGYRDAEASSRAVMTWYHGHPADPNLENQAMIRTVGERSASLERVVTSSMMARTRLISWGVPKVKVALIPIGVDLELYRPASPAERALVRRSLGLAEDQICLGLFHKDGEGWGEGLKPKWVKAPDVFLDVVERLAARYPIFVLLTGPARGFVIEGLKRLGIPYRHRFLEEPAQVAGYYHALDLYVIPSREEGGPKALLESFASGVPVVSTRVGMSLDLIRPGENGLLAEVDDAEGLACAAASLIDSPSLRQQLAEQALADVQPFAWPRVATQLYQKVYRPLLAGPGHSQPE
jgi:glycosyltransferase involved in cell wall biosynthesis